MLLASWPLPEFAKFLQLVTWIILPVLLLSVLVTLFLHYRSLKRKKSGADKEDEAGWFDATGSIPVNRNTATHILLDHTGVIRQYQDKLSYHHARYAALQQDFKLLASKYSAILEQIPSLQLTFKKYDMEKTIAQHPVTNDMAVSDIQEKQSLLDRLEQLDRSSKWLESENKTLLEQLSYYSANGDEKEKLSSGWREEITRLKHQVTEQGYLKELLKEKKIQVEFLQDQVDEQIIIVHRLSKQQEELEIELETAERNRLGTLTELTAVKQEQRRQDHVIDQLRLDLAEKENNLDDKETLLGTQANELICLQSIIRETKEQNELLQADLADNHDKVVSLQEKLIMEESRVARTMQKLEDNQQMLKKFQRTLSDYIGEEQETQVIELKPVYINNETEGWN